MILALSLRYVSIGRSSSCNMLDFIGIPRKVIIDESYCLSLDLLYFVNI